MNFDRKLTRRDAVAAAVFAVSVTVLGVQLLNPTPVVITVEGGATETEQMPSFFTYSDMLTVVVSSVLAGASATYLLRPTPQTAAETAGSADVDAVSNGESEDDKEEVDLIEKRKEEWQEYAEELHNGEKEIYEVVLESDGVVQQSTIVEETDLSKSHVSRKLDVLESRELVERKRRGMGNVVVLK